MFMTNEMWLIWKEPETRQRYTVGKLLLENNKYKIQYVNPELNDAIKVGFDYFPGFPNINASYESDELFPNIETRLPNKSRPDYLDILNSYGLDKDSTKLDILKATKGRLITDNYEFVPVFNKNKVEFDVAGTRHCTDVQKCKNLIKVNDKLELEMEPNNKYDQNAIKVIFTNKGIRYHLGYVPRYYTKELTKLLKEDYEYSALIESLNFESELNDEDITAYVKLIFSK